jgi:hypothetical protein
VYFRLCFRICSQTGPAWCFFEQRFVQDQSGLFVCLFVCLFRFTTTPQFQDSCLCVPDRIGNPCHVQGDVGGNRPSNQESRRDREEIRRQTTSLTSHCGHARCAKTPTSRTCSSQHGLSQHKRVGAHALGRHPLWNRVAREVLDDVGNRGQRHRLYSACHWHKRAALHSVAHAYVNRWPVQCRGGAYFPLGPPSTPKNWVLQGLLGT